MNVKELKDDYVRKIEAQLQPNAFTPQHRIWARMRENLSEMSLGALGDLWMLILCSEKK
jgi:hypothetical protein